MPRRRQLAAWVLRFGATRAAAADRAWAGAMLRELDFVEGDWAALRWALGGALAIGVRSMQTARSSGRLNAKAVVSVFSGVVVAVAVLALSMMIGESRMHPTTAGWRHTSAAQLVFIVIIPELAFLLGVYALWRRHRRMAIGIIATGAMVITHAVIHVIT
ncbi:MAG TPA: hypothetical protein VN706_05640 [Gemmatimonadaceae bacterium]|nr:hypothetical protein [Gemmatimonadaceae bacterium]